MYRPITISNYHHIQSINRRCLQCNLQYYLCDFDNKKFDRSYFEDIYSKELCDKLNCSKKPADSKKKKGKVSHKHESVDPQNYSAASDT